MATATTSTSQNHAGGTRVFDHVLVGVDRSPESIEAARQAAIVVRPEGLLTILAAWDVPPPVITVGIPASNEPLYRNVARHAAAAAKGAAAPHASAAVKIAQGLASGLLIKEADATGAQLIVVGSHGQGRLEGIVLGSTATEVVHRARCSVLVARAADALFPRRIVVGVDGSCESAAAYAVARELADRFGSELWPVVGHGGKGVDEELVARVVGDHREDLQEEPVRALVAAAADADLVVVGSRGLHGFKSLGSVSERVAHRAHCSTLIVRQVTQRNVRTSP